MSIKNNATTVLTRLAQLEQEHPTLRNDYLDAKLLDRDVKLGPARLSDAVALLEENGYLDVMKSFGTAPYDFGSVQLTSRGRFEAERVAESAADPAPVVIPVPVAVDGPSPRDDRAQSSVIARDIIAADIAVLETSDLNENVMIEMGVALTWGTRVLPIRRHDAPQPPSDISGQTWATYDADGSVWEDADTARRLAKMVELAALRKPRRG